MQPFSDKIVFVDAEFSTLEPYQGEIIALALIKPSGEELYVELECPGECDTWVTENVLPKLKLPKISRAQAIAAVKDFLGDTQPYLMAFVNQFDTVFLHKLFGIENWPFHWLPLDFASMMFAAGHDPEKELKLAKELGLHTGDYQLHNALDDARLLRDVYRKFFAGN